MLADDMRVADGAKLGLKLMERALASLDDSDPTASAINIFWDASELELRGLLALRGSLAVSINLAAKITVMKIAGGTKDELMAEAQRVGLRR